MKRLLWIIVVLLILAGVGFMLVRSTSGFRSIYYVPENAGLIIESKNPIAAWNQIIKNNAWSHFRKNEFLSELNADINYFDSLLQSNKVLLKLAGEKPVMISQHLVSAGKYDYLYIIDIGKIARVKNPEKALRGILGKNYEITSRTYKEHTIVEMYDKIEQENSYLCLSNGKLLFSFNQKLIPASIDALEKMVIGSDTQYLDVKSKIGSKGLFSITIVHENYKQILGILSPTALQNFERHTKGMAYSSLYFDISTDGLISIKGYSSFSDESKFNYLSLLENSSVKLECDKIIPNRLASMAKVNFDDAAVYFQNSMLLLGEKEYAEYMANLRRVEERLKVDLNKNLFSWMDREMVFIQTQPSNLGRKNEFAIVMHAKDSALAADNLQIIWKQLKKHTPIKIKKVIYRGYQIDYIGFPGILKMLFGKVIKNIDKPYFCVIADQVVISNHPQTIKNIIDDYLSGKTLAESRQFQDFEKLFNSNAGAIIYIEPVVLFHNLKELVTKEKWLKLNKNKEYFTCFSQGRIQVENKGDLLLLDMKLQYVPDIESWPRQFYNSSEFESQFMYVQSVKPEETKQEETDTIPTIEISDLDAKKYHDYFESGKLKLEVDIKDGMKHGDLKVYHENGILRISGEFKRDKPSGKWKYYDSEGKLIKTDKY